MKKPKSIKHRYLLTVDGATSNQKVVTLTLKGNTVEPVQEVVSVIANQTSTLKLGEVPNSPSHQSKTPGGSLHTSQSTPTLQGYWNHRPNLPTVSIPESKGIQCILT